MIPHCKGWGLLSSLENSTRPEDRAVDSEWLEHRNHHTGSCSIY